MGRKGSPFLPSHSTSHLTLNSRSNTWRFLPRANVTDASPSKSSRETVLNVMVLYVDICVCVCVCVCVVACALASLYCRDQEGGS